MPDNRKPVAPNPPRWKPSSDPASIEVPGLDTNASVSDQIEQIEQLITIKLQNIDENFAKIHSTLANKILPAVKRYAVGTEPVREAAQFWTSFYEQAAQIRIPTYDEDYSTVNEVPSEREEEPDTTTTQEYDATAQEYSRAQESQPYEPSMVNTESSFMPAQGAISSTPATSRKTRPEESFLSHGSDDVSWTRNIQSPLVRLSREIQSLSAPDETLQPEERNAPSMRYDESLANQTQQDESIVLPRSEKSKGKEPLLRGVLRHNLYSASDISSGVVSPLKYKGKPKTPVPKNLNPYLPSNSDASKWSGIVDLRNQSLQTPPRAHLGRKLAPRGGTTTPDHDSDDDSIDGLPPGMSPPVMLSPARPSKRLQLGKTPSKEASARITKDLVRDFQIQSSGGGRGNIHSYSQSRIESTLSSAPTPPSLSHYRSFKFDTSESVANDSTFESLMARVNMDYPANTATSGLRSTPGLRIRPRENQRSESQQSKPGPAVSHTPAVTHTPQSDNAGPLWAASDDLATPGYDDSDSDSMGDFNDTAHPSAAFLMASERRHSDDSFGSSNHSSDSLNDDAAGVGIVPVHPFAGAVEDDGFDDDDDDDSFDDNVPEETVFGVPPAQRLQGRPVHPAEGLRMLGEDLLQETGIIDVGRVPEESPIPASWSARDPRNG